MLKPGTDEDINMPIEGRSVANFKIGRDKVKKAFGITDDFYNDGKADAINTGLIQAGLAIAGGTSANPLENISKGASPALAAFNKEQARLSGAKRLENLASMNAYTEEQKEIRGYQASLLDRFYQNAAAAAAKKGDLDAEAHVRTVEYMNKFIPGGIKQHYAGKYEQHSTDYARIYNVILASIKSGTPLTEEQARDLTIQGGTYPSQKNNVSNTSSKLKLLP